jgi:hypothetical protein
MNLPKVRQFVASVSYRDATGEHREEEFPVQTFDYSSANDLAFAYVLQALRLDEFELRLVGA